jgi:hypothetical protein
MRFFRIERPNVIYDLVDSEMGEWEGPRIPLDKFDEVGNTKVKKPEGYVVLLGTPLRGSLKVPHKPFGEGGLPW